MIEFLITSLLTSIPWMFIIYTLYNSPEKFEKWSSIIFTSFSWANLEYEKRGIKEDIRSDLRGIKRKFNLEKENILPYDIDINWCKEDTKESFIKRNKVIVRMQHHKNQAKNMMFATLLYVEGGLLPNSKNYVDKNVLRASQLILTNKIFSEQKRESSKQIFLDLIYQPEISKSSSLERYCNILNTLEKNGHFTRIFLQEINIFGKKINRGTPTREISNETVEYLKSLERFAQRRRGELDSPGFIGKYIKTSIVLIAKQDTYLTYGIDPYIRYINQSLNNDINTFYLCAIGDPNISIVKQILEVYENSSKIKLVNKEVYKLSNKYNAFSALLVKNS